VPLLVRDRRPHRLRYIGLFIGPVVLAVTYKLLEAWVAGDENESASDSGGK
jgi:predicted PurR-regulated permease PerM